MKKTKGLKFGICLLLLLSFSIACTQKREPKLPDGLEENIYAIADLEKASFLVSGSAVRSNGLTAETSSEEMELEVQSSNPRLNNLFKGLKGRAQAEGFEARIKVTPYYVEVYELIKKPSQVSNSLKALVEGRGSEQMIPVFAFPLQGFGKLVRARNNLNQETSILRMQLTEWNQATHVQVSFNDSTRQMIALDPTEAERTFEIESFSDSANSRFQVTLSKDEKQILKDRKYINFRQVVSTTATDKIKLLLSDLYLPGQAGETYDVVLKLAKTALTGYRLVQNSAKLQSFEKSLLVQIDGQLALPLFQIPYNKVGRLSRVKNTSGYKMASLFVDSVDWSQATHVSFSIQSSTRKLISLDPNEDLGGEILLTKTDLNNRILKVKDLKALIGISLDLPAEDSVRLKLYNGELAIYHLTTLDNPMITDPVRRSFLAGSPELARWVERCGKDVTLSSNSQKPNSCIELYAFSLSVQMSQVFIPRSQDEGVISPQLRRRAVNTLDAADLVVINPNRLPERIFDHAFLSPENFLYVESVRNKEYLFRRTMLDSPKKLLATIPGMKGQLEIVKFEFTDDRVLVRRSDSIDPDVSITDVDHEVFISMPTKYVVRVQNRSDGSLSPQSLFVPSHPQAPGAIALINWAQNEVARVASPISYFASGQCFNSETAKEVLHLDNRLKDKTSILNFTLVGTFSLNPRVNCSNQWLTAGLVHYWLQSQANFTLKERISLKEYSRANDAPPVEAIPYQQQKMLGFGYFTFDKKNPNEFNNVGRGETQTPLMMIHDFRGGKTVDYVLTGLPENNPKLKAMLIARTQKVVSQWNSALRKAFFGTSLYRNGDYLKLKVGTPDDFNRFGDLDQNQIHYVDKSFQMGVLGMINPTANPRSGIMEASDVMVYGGNLRNAAEYYQRTVKARKEYRSRMNAARSKPAATVNAARLTPLSGGSVATTTKSEDTELMRELARGLPLSLASLPRIPLSSTYPADFDSSRISSFEIRSAEDLKQAAFWGTMLSELGASGKLYDANTLDEKLTETLLANLDKIPGLTPEKREELRLEVTQAAYFNSVKAAINAGPQVLEEMPPDITGDKFLNMSVDEMIAEMYESTLSHELGHTLGLRHNFLGSYDKNNWHFDEADKQNGRNYSSIMEYMADYDQVYQGPGPYDVHALRAGYTGNLLAPNAKSATDFVKISDVLRQTGKNSWREVWPQDVARAQFKRFAFCSDEDTSRYPICNRHDQGTSPAAIVRDHIERYHQTYAIANFRDDRIAFDNWSLFGYLRRMIGTFFQIRHFLDEGFFRIREVQENSQANENPSSIDLLRKSDAESYIEAAQTGRNFFHALVRAPEASRLTDPADRFVEHYDGTGYTVFEKKWSRDIFEPGVSGELRIRGIEYDRMFALLMLTLRGIGMTDYEDAMVRISYVDLEKILGGGVDGLGLPTISLITEVLSDRIQPGFIKPDGTLVRIPDAQYYSQATELVQLYAAFSAMFNLDTLTVDPSDNYSQQFRFLSSINDAHDRLDYIIELIKKNVTGPSDDERRPSVLTHLGEYPRSRSVIKYEPFESAQASQKIFRTAADLRLILENEKEIVKRIVDYYNTRYQITATEMAMEKGIAQPSETVEGRVYTRLDALNIKKKELKEHINQDFLKFFPGTVGTREIEELVSLMDRQVRYALELDALKKAGTSNKEMIDQVLKWQISNLNTLKAQPIAHYAFMALIDDKLEMDRQIKNLMPIVYNPYEGRRHFSQVFMNIKFLNMLFYLTHPEYAK